ncbi:MAG: hypothetical protein ACXV5T_06350 [Halobacteriota archaeon]
MNSHKIAMLYTDDHTYAEYLKHTFGMLWQQAIPTEQRVKELEKQGPPRSIGKGMLSGRIELVISLL